MLMPAQDPNPTGPAVATNPENDSFPSTGRLRIAVQQDNVIYDVLTTLARVHAAVKQFHYESCSIEVTYEARPFVLRRIPSLMAALVQVVEVESLDLD